MTTNKEPVPPADAGRVDRPVGPPEMSAQEAERIARQLGAGHPLVTLANELSREVAGRLPSWCCQKCGRPAGWLGRVFCGVLYPHDAANGRT